MGYLWLALVWVIVGPPHQTTVIINIAVLLLLFLSSEIRRFKPRKTLLIGMSHEFHYPTHNDLLAELKQTEGIDVQLSYDGMLVAPASLNL